MVKAQGGDILVWGDPEMCAGANKIPKLEGEELIGEILESRGITA